MFDVQYSPADFDVLLTDVHSNELHHEISETLGTAYLENASSSDTKEAKGIIWGPHNRIFVATVVKMGNALKHVHFLVDTGSPFTIHVNGMPILVLQSPENKHFRDINILGTDFMKTFGCVLTVDFDKETAKLVYNSD